MIHSTKAMFVYILKARFIFILGVEFFGKKS